MASASLESVAEFESRARYLGVSEPAIVSLRGANLNTYGRFAFSVAYTPGSPDESPLIDMLQRILRVPAIEPGLLASLRRLYWESHTLSLADLKSKAEHGTDSIPKKLPTAERQARADAQRVKLSGLVWSVETEPSHALVDRFVNMHEEQVISYVKPELCTSRSQEIVGNKQTQAFSLAPDGSLKVKDKDPEIECNVSGEMRLRMAFQRRSLAADLARVVSFAASEEWTLYLFAILQRETPKGFKSVSMSQLIAADKHMWILLSEKSRGNVVAGPGQPLPCDAHLKTLSSSPEVLNFLTPLPEPQFVDRRPAPYTSSSSKGDGKGKKGKEPKGKSAVLSVPENCHLNTPEGKPICLLFQKGNCWQSKKVKPGKRCSRGMHICYQCFKHKPWHECSHD